MWLWIYTPRAGCSTQLLGVVRHPAPEVESDPFWAMPAIIAMSVWQGLGVSVIIFLAGLQAIPAEYHDAASVDGAGRWAPLPQRSPCRC